MNRRDGHNIVFNINSVYITINYYQRPEDSRDFRNNNERGETNQTSTPAAADVNQKDNTENNKTCQTSKNHENTDSITLRAVASNQSITSRSNENSNLENEDSVQINPGDLETELVSNNDKITKSTPQKDSQSGSGNQSNDKITTFSPQHDSHSESEEKPKCHSDPKNIAEKIFSLDNIFSSGHATTSDTTEPKDTSSESESVEKLKDERMTNDNPEKSSKEVKKDDNKENIERQKAFNPNLSFNFSPDLLKMEEKETNDLVLSERPSFQFTNLRRSAPESCFKFQAKLEKPLAVEESRTKLSQRHIFIRSKVTSPSQNRMSKKLMELENRRKKP